MRYGEQPEQLSSDLQTTLTLSQDEAFFGSVRTLTLPTGQSIDIYIPPRAYNGQRLYPAYNYAQDSRDPDQLFFITIIIASAGQNIQQTRTYHLERPLSGQHHAPGMQQSEINLQTDQPANPATQHTTPGIDQKVQQNIQVRRRNISTRTILTLLVLFIVTGTTIAYLAGHNTYLIQSRLSSQDNPDNVQNRSVSSVEQLQRATDTARTDTTQAQQDYDTIRQQAPALNDHLQAPDVYHWETGIGCAYTNGVYAVDEAQKNLIMSCTALNTRYADFMYQVDMSIIQGDAGGIIFRADTDHAQFYLFQIGQNGSYDVYYYPEQTGKYVRHLLSGVSGLIHTGKRRENLVGVLAHGNSLKFYINERYLASVEQNELTTGQIGVVAASDTSATAVRYTLAEVWQIIARPTAAIQK